jgi:hypothetical protein
VSKNPSRLTDFRSGRRHWIFVFVTGKSLQTVAFDGNDPLLNEGASGFLKANFKLVFPGRWC